MSKSRTIDMNVDSEVYDQLHDHDDEEKPAPLRSMLKNSALVYDYAALRQLVNKHDETMTRDMDESKKDEDIVQFDTPSLVVTKHCDSSKRHLQSTVLKHSVTFPAILEFVQKNRNLIGEECAALKPVEDRKKKPEDFPKLKIEKRLEKMISRFDIAVWEFDDEYESSELVFAIVVNKTEKRIVCVFRGSMTGSDWLTNLTATQSNPDITKEFAPKAGLHSGFANYLFNETTNDECKFKQVVKAIREIREKKDPNGDNFADYDIFVTGHSLGGALSQLLAFALSGSELSKDLPTPITAVTFASPQPGNLRYVRAFQKLEAAGKLRHIRVSNAGDHVCVQPAVPFYGYSQTGVNVHVSDGYKADVGYRNQRSAFSAFYSAISPFTALKMHGLPTYLERLVGNPDNKDIIDKSIEDFYDEYAGDFTA
jgi:hypothetical protein